MIWLCNSDNGEHSPATSYSQFTEVIKSLGRLPVIISRTVPVITGVPQHLCCFPICKVFKEVLQGENLKMELASGALIIEDQFDNPMIISHCVVRVTKLSAVGSEPFEILMDPSFEGPSSYGAPSDCDYSFVMKEKVVSTFIELGIDPRSLPDHVADGIENGVERVEEWWTKELTPTNRIAMLEFVRYYDKEILGREEM